MILALGVGFLAAPASAIKPATGGAQYSHGRLHDSPWFTCFSTQGDCTGILVNAIDLARKTILVQAYELGSERIERALVGAKERGVNVQVVLDKHKLECGQSAVSPPASAPRAGKTAGQSASQAEPAAGLPARWDPLHDFVRHESLVLDGREVIEAFFGTRRSPFSCGVGHLLAIRDRELAKVFIDNWQRHAKHAEVRPGR